MPRFAATLLVLGIVALLGGPASEGFAPASYAIVGKIWGPVDLENTVVTLSGPVSRTSKLTSDAIYRFDPLRPDTFTVTPSCPGTVFDPPWRTVTIQPTPRGRGTVQIDFRVVSGPSGGGGGGMPRPEPPIDPNLPAVDDLVVHRLKDRPEKGKLKLRATLVPGSGHAVLPEDGLTVWLDERTVLDVPPDAFEDAGTKLRYRAEGIKVTLKPTGGRTGSMTLKVKLRGLERSDPVDSGSGAVIAVRCGTFGAAR